MTATHLIFLAIGALSAFGLSWKLFQMATKIRKKGLQKMGLNAETYADRQLRAFDPYYGEYHLCLQGAYAFLFVTFFFLVTGAMVPIFAEQTSTIWHITGVLSGIAVIALAKWTQAPKLLGVLLSFVALAGILVNVVLLLTP